MNSILNPASAAAADVVHLWWWMFGVATVVWVAVTVATVLSLRKRRAAGTDVIMKDDVADRRAVRVVAVAGVVTALILFAFMGFNISVGRAQSHHAPAGLTITVEGHQWWWEFIYEDTSADKRLVTANEIHVPVGVPVTFVLKSPDVIHSAWMPNLGGKHDLIPGYTGMLTFTADTAGTYRGLCAEFCGEQHAKMSFLVTAVPPATFEQWWADQQKPAPPPVDSLLMEGQRVFLSGPCATCHAIGGTPAMASVGPDLSWFGRRRTIGAGALPNTPGNLAAWIIDPQGIKPGTKMPAVPLPPAQLRAVVAYLESLK